MEQDKEEFDVKIMSESWDKADRIAKERNISDKEIIKDIAITFFIQKMNFINKRGGY
jgi:predicted HTH domain antitoxin